MALCARLLFPPSTCLVRTHAPLAEIVADLRTPHPLQRTQLSAPQPTHPPFPHLYAHPPCLSPHPYSCLTPLLCCGPTCTLPHPRAHRHRFLAKCVVAVAISQLGDNVVRHRPTLAELVTIPLFQILQTTRQRQAPAPGPDRPGTEFCMSQLRRPDGTDDIPQHLERAPTVRQKHVGTALTGVLRALDQLAGLMQDIRWDSVVFEHNVQPLSHLRALHFFAQGHQIEIFCIFGAIPGRRRRCLS